MSTPTVKSLFADATTEGALSEAGGQAIMVIPDYGAQIQNALGVAVDDVEAGEVTLVTSLIDDSGSIRFVKGNTEAMREGANAMLDALEGSKQKEGILTHCRYLNGTVLYPYCSLDQAVRFDASNYNPTGGTPLYDQTALILGTVLAKAQEFTDAGVPCRTITVIATDGADQHSVTHRTPSSVRPLVLDMLKTEMHIIAAMGIDDGCTDFTSVFEEMGIPKEWILTPRNTPSEIRKAFALVSQTAVRASQAAGGTFSRVAAGGFGS